MTMTTGPLTTREMRDVFDAGALLNVAPVMVSMLLAVRNTWGGTVHRYDGKRGFFIDPSEARKAAGKQRTAGTAFQVHEVPGLRLDAADQSIVLLSVNEPIPFADWAQKPRRSNERFRVGLHTGVAIMTVGDVTSPTQATASGLVALDVPRGVTLKPVRFEACRSWSSWPAKPLQWIQRGEPEFEGTGVRDTALLFARQSGKDALSQARKTLRQLGVPVSAAQRDLKIVPR